MKIRHLSAILGIGAAVGAVVFVKSLVATNDHQAEAVARQLIESVSVERGAKFLPMQLDYRPDGHVMQGKPMMASLATSSKVAANEIWVTRALFAQRSQLPLPKIGDELTLVGEKGAYKLKIAGFIDWARAVRGYPNAFVAPVAVSTIGEDWKPFKPVSVEDLAPNFKSDANRHFDRSKPMLLWAAVLTALCLLLNSLFLSIEARRRELAIMRTLGMTRAGVIRLVLSESLALSFVGFIVGAALSLVALRIYVATDVATFPMGMAVSMPSMWTALALTPVIAVVGTLLALKKALSVSPLEAASIEMPRPRRLGMLVAFACGFGAFVAVEVWGTSLTKPFIPSKEWPDAIVSILPGGVSSFEIEKLQSLKGVRRIAELQPLQVNIEPLEPLKEKPSPMAKRGRGAAYRNALLLASDWLPDFKLVAGDRESAVKALLGGDNCIITEMMARARKLKLGDSLKLDCGRGLHLALKIVGIADLNWHMVTSRGLVRGLNRMPVNTDGPVFVSFDTLAACDARPQEMVKMTHLWLDYEPAFLAERGVFPAGREVEREIVAALGISDRTVRLHARDEIADGTLSHGADLVGAMARVPFIFLVVVSFGFVAMLIASADSRSREFVVMRSIGATRLQLAIVLIKEALGTSLKAMVIGLPGGALAGWLFTSGTRAAMANWGLPAAFDLPIAVISEGAALALLVVLLIAVPTSLAIIRARCRR